jgi:hypothetical protein
MIPSVRNRLEAIIELFLKNNFGPSFLVNLYSFMLYHPLIQEDLVFIEDTEERLRSDPSLSRSNIVSHGRQEGIEKIRLLISDLYEPILDKIRSAYTNLQTERPDLYPIDGPIYGRNQRKHKKRSTRTQKSIKSENIKRIKPEQKNA